METIEERATEIFENYPHPYEMPYDDNAYFDGEQVVDMMVKIATEQKKIDEERLAVLDAEGNPVTAETLHNACEIVRNTTRQKMIDKACNLVEILFKVMKTYDNKDALIKEFKKAMEEYV